ncbi:MAG: hypothetical protein B7733_07845 [Myxococcales bacterium FL481]|nr:MAG: hypothetical protein B7733_07845 [Myxococcales bacterium FL481]
MSAVAKIRTVVCASHAAARRGIEQAVAGGGDFAVVGQATTASQAFTVVRESIPDFLVVDDALPDATGEALLLELANERVVPALLFADEGPRASGELRRVGVSTMPRRLLFGDADAQAHVRTRLQVISARCSSQRRTQSVDALAGALARVRQGEIERRFSPEVAAIVARPLELVVLVGGRGSARALLSVFAGLERLPAPLVTALQDGDYYRLRAVERTPISELEHGVMLRALRGAVLVGPNQHVEIGDQFLHVSRDALDLPGFLRSVAALGDRVLVVVVAGELDDEVTGYDDVVRAGGAMAVLSPDPGATGDVNREAIGRTPAAAVVDIPALTWLLQNTVPRRT